MQKLISICIPAYEEVSLLRRLLESIKNQTFIDYEVIITDDSPGDDIQKLATYYASYFDLQYHRNLVVLGSPANWNRAIKLARGEWIKVMHHDDWLAKPEALEVFANYAKKSQDDLIFSAYSNITEGTRQNVLLSKLNQKALHHNPLHLFVSNYVGNPSTTLVRNNRNSWYDENLKWVVDFEFYLQILKAGKFNYINDALINVGIHERQVTKSVFRNRAVEIPENIYMLKKHGLDILKNVKVFDYYWRIFRNLEVRSVAEVQEHLQDEKCPLVLQQMLKRQFNYSLSFLKNGFKSKAAMLMAYAAFKSESKSSSKKELL